MTLLEAKDHVAKKQYAYDLKRHFTGFDDMKGYMSYHGQWPTLLEKIEEAAELYARAKWDEAAKVTRYEIGLSWVRCEMDRNIEYRAINNAPIPEFKP